MPSQRPKTSHEIQGFEYDWLATDEDAHVALFSTAGGGAAPSSFLRDTESHDAAIDLILQLPVSTTVRFAPDLKPEVQNTWRLVAENGLFAYDSDPNGGPSRLVAAPSSPTLLETLPKPAAAVAVRIRLSLCFGREEIVGFHLIP